YLIGANARDVALYKAGQKPTRATGDIDFAIMLPDISTYEALLQELVNNGFFPQKKQEGYRMHHRKTNTLIDLLPYGGIAGNNLVELPGTGIELSVVGLAEVGEEIQEFDHPEGLFENSIYFLLASPLFMVNDSIKFVYNSLKSGHLIFEI
ncbi:hypothetical protein, partial [Salinimicrobium oceani]|nr:hypothetical protein [Salinimicrobium oceani]